MASAVTPWDSYTFRTGHVARNRLAVAPMTNENSNLDGTLSDDEYRFLTMRAEGGYGIVITCCCHVSFDGQGWEGELANFSDAHLPGLTRLAAGIKSHGALAINQIFHGGAAGRKALSGVQAISSSACEANPRYDAAREATEEDIERVVKDFVDAAVRAHKAGFDGVELHGANGYFLTQFISVLQNKRTDSYGGSLENRARVYRMVMQRVRAAVPKDFIVGMRLQPENSVFCQGLDFDETLQVQKWMVEDGADYIHLSMWNANDKSAKYPTKHIVTEFKAALPPNIPLMAAGHMWSRADVEEAIGLGLDFAALGRSAIANPLWPKEALVAGWEVKRAPLTAKELRERGLGERFTKFMNYFKFVKEEEVAA